MNYEQKVLEIICEYSGFTPEDLKSRDNTTELSDTIKLVCFFLRNFSSTKRMGEIINRERTSCVYAVKKVKNLLEARDKDMTEKVNSINAKIQEWKWKERT